MRAGGKERGKAVCLGRKGGPPPAGFPSPVAWGPNHTAAELELACRIPQHLGQLELGKGPRKGYEAPFSWDITKGESI